MLPLFALLRRMTEQNSFLPPFFPTSDISAFWGTSIVITSSGAQEVRPTPVGRKYSTQLSLLTSSPSTNQTYLLLLIAPLAVAPPLTFPLLPPLSPIFLLGGASGPEF